LRLDQDDCLRVAVISIEEAGRGPLTIPVWYRYTPGGTTNSIINGLKVLPVKK